MLYDPKWEGPWEYRPERREVYHHPKWPLPIVLGGIILTLLLWAWLVIHGMSEFVQWNHERLAAQFLVPRRGFFFEN